MPEEENARDRLRAAARRPSRAQFVVAGLLAVLGFAGVTQVVSNQAENPYSSYREQDLIDVLTGLTGATRRAEQELERLERTRQELLTSTNARATAVEQARKEADALAILAGSVPVTGPGLRITITEEDGRIRVDTLLDTIQELRTAGAEAMEFNDQVRLGASSSLEDGIGGIFVDDTLLTAPYVLDVIGEPNTLAGALRFPLGPLDAVRKDGGAMEIQEMQSVDIETVREAPRPEFAEADDDQ